MKRVLTIAGSDCSGGAGIQADIKTISAHGVYAMSVIVSVVAENTVHVLKKQDIAPEIVRAVSDVKRIVEDMPVNQGKLVIGMRSGVTLHDPDYPAMLMFNEIFGGGVTSKLFMNVREKMSLCYYCSSSPDSYKGLLFVQSGIEVENREVAETAINDQLEAVRRGEFTEEEMRSAYLGLVNSYRELSDSARGLESWYLGRMLAGVGGAPDDVSERLSVVTKDEIIAAAKKSAVDTVYFLRGTLKGDGSEGDEEDA